MCLPCSTNLQQVPAVSRAQLSHKYGSQKPTNAAAVSPPPFSSASEIQPVPGAACICRAAQPSSGQCSPVQPSPTQSSPVQLIPSTAHPSSAWPRAAGERSAGCCCALQRRQGFLDFRSSPERSLRQPWASSPSTQAGLAPTPSRVRGKQQTKRFTEVNK